jgi:hypothetical protein
MGPPRVAHKARDVDSRARIINVSELSQSSARLRNRDFFLPCFPNSCLNRNEPMQAYDPSTFDHDDGSREALLADLLDYAIIGARHLERDLTDFRRRSQAMMAEEIPPPRAFLPSIFDNAKRFQEFAHKLHPR